MLKDHAARMDGEAKTDRRSRTRRCDAAHGSFFAPRAYAIELDRRAAQGDLRPGAARGALEGGPARQRDRRDQRHRLRPDAGHPLAHRRDRREDRLARSRSATATSTATRSARWSACSRSAARTCPAPAPRPAARTTCRASPPRRRITVNTTAAGGNASLADAGRLMRSRDPRKPDHAGWIAKKKPRQSGAFSLQRRSGLRLELVLRRNAEQVGVTVELAHQARAAGRADIHLANCRSRCAGTPRRR